MYESFPHELSKKYADLPGTPEVNKSVAKDKSSRGKSKDDRIDAYLQFLDNRLSHDDLLVMGDKKDDINSILKIQEQKALENPTFLKLKFKLINDFTMQLGDEKVLADIAKGIYESEKKIAIERGQGNMITHITDEKAMIERYKQLIVKNTTFKSRHLVVGWTTYSKTTLSTRCGSAI